MGSSHQWQDTRSSSPWFPPLRRPLQHLRQSTCCNAVTPLPLFLPRFSGTLAGLADESVKWRELHVVLARYATYLGLCVATFIIFKRNVYAASVIGVLVAVYIGFSEYTLANWKEHSVTSTFKNVLAW